MTQHFVGGLVTVAGIIVEEVGQHFAALDFPCVKVHGLTDITHSLFFVIYECYLVETISTLQRN